jgi:hypothetical protein
MTEMPWQISAIRPYRDRHISYLQLANIFGRRLKLYGVSVSESGVINFNACPGFQVPDFIMRPRHLAAPPTTAR